MSEVKKKSKKTKGKKGKTKSPYGLSERRQRAYELYGRGRMPAEVARRLDVSLKTACRYRDEFEDSVRDEVRNNPSMMSEFLENTIRMLRENNMIRAEAWDQYELASSDRVYPCPEEDCDGHVTVPSASHQTLNQYLNTITKAQDQRAKLLGLFGVKHEFFLHVQNVRIVQEALVTFLRDELCTADRAKVERFLTTGAVAEAFQATQGLPAIDVESAVA